jgi:hypothetical protein
MPMSEQNSAEGGPANSARFSATTRSRATWSSILSVPAWPRPRGSGLPSHQVSCLLPWGGPAQWRAAPPHQRLGDGQPAHAPLTAPEGEAGNPGTLTLP